MDRVFPLCKIIPGDSPLAEGHKEQTEEREQPGGTRRQARSTRPARRIEGDTVSGGPGLPSLQFSQAAAPLQKAMQTEEREQPGGTKIAKFDVNEDSTPRLDRKVVF